MKPSEAALLWAHIAEPPTLASVVRPELGAGADAVLARGLAESPAERPATASAFVDALAAALSASGPAATTVVTPGRHVPAKPAPQAAGRRLRRPQTARRPRPHDRPRRRRRLLGALAAAVLVAAAIVAGLALWASPTRRRRGRGR